MCDIKRCKENANRPSHSVIEMIDFLRVIHYSVLQNFENAGYIKKLQHEICYDNCRCGTDCQESDHHKHYQLFF